MLLASKPFLFPAAVRSASGLFRQGRGRISFGRFVPQARRYTTALCRLQSFCIHRRQQRRPLTLRGFQLIDRTDFLAGLRRIPLVENTVKWQHFHSFAGCGIDVFLYGDKGNAKGRIDHLRQPAHLDLLSSKTGYILYDDRPDLSVLRHSLHPLKIRSLKSRPGNSIVHKENRVQIPMFFSVVQ